MRPALVLLFLLQSALAALAAPVAAQRRPAAYVAPTSETVFTSSEESAGSTPGHVIWVNNRSTVPIIVFGAALRDCENVRNSCGPMRLNIKVRPNSRSPILRVYAKNPMEGFRYSSSFSWRADSAALAALRVLADAGSSEAQQRIADDREAEQIRRETIGAGDIYLTREDVQSLGERIAAIRAEPESVVVREGRGFLLREVRIMALDSAGNALGRATGLSWRFPSTGVIITKGDTIVGNFAGRVELEIRLAPPAAARTTTLPIIVLPDSAPALAWRAPARRPGVPTAR